MQTKWALMANGGQANIVPRSGEGLHGDVSEHCQRRLDMVLSMGVGTAEVSLMPISPSPPTSGPFTKGPRALQAHCVRPLQSTLQGSDEHRL